MAILWRFFASLIILALLTGVSNAATGNVIITSHNSTQISDVQSNFSIVGTYTLLTDTTPIGVSNTLSCIGLTNSTGASSFSPDYWDWIQWTGTWGSVHYNIDGVYAGTIGEINWRNGANPTNDLGISKNFGIPISTGSMVPGSIHTATVYIMDVYGKTCKWYRWWGTMNRVSGALVTKATLTFRIADPSPSVTINLNKPSLTGCEPETGTITVTSNDPTPNGGTVILTLPDQSTLSAIFTGKTATLTFADFGLPNGYSGAHKPGDVLIFKADVRTTAGHRKTASANALVANYTASIVMNSPTVNGLISGVLTINPINGCVLSGSATIIFNGATFPININGAGAYPFSFDTQGLVAGNYDVTAAVTINGNTVNVVPATVFITSPIPPPPVGNPVRGCGLTVALSPNGDTLEPVLQSRTAVSKIDQPLSARTRLINISISDALNRSVKGATVLATVEMVPGTETFGGHDHGITVNTRPLGTISPVKEVNGVYTTTYTSTIYAAQDQIRVKASFNGCTTEVISAPFVSEIGGLIQFSTIELAGLNRVGGGTCHHHGPADSGTTCTSPNNNHHLRQTSLDKLIRLQRAYSVKYPNSGGLRVNDASLPNGGKFEVCNDSSQYISSHCINRLWKTHSFGHITHRRGVDVDIGTRDSYGKYTLTKDRLLKLNIKNGRTLFRYIKDESAQFHLHIYLE